MRADQFTIAGATPGPPATALAAIRRFYAYRIVSRAYFYLPVLVIIFRERGVSITAIGWLVAAHALVLTVMQVPAGRWSDRMGRRRFLVAGETAKGLGVLLLASATSFGGFLVAQLVGAFGYALAAGTDSALLFELHRNAGMDEAYKRNETRSQGWAFMSVLVAGVLGAVALEADLRAPLLLTVPFCLAAAVLAYGFPADSPRSTTSSPAPFLPPRVLPYAVFYAVHRAVVMALFVLLLPLVLFTRTDVDLIYFGLILGSFSLAAFGAGRALPALSRHGHERVAWVVPVAIGAGLALLLWAGKGGALIAPALLGVGAGLVRPVSVSRILAVVGPDHRARALSIGELLFGVFNALIVLVAAWATERRGVDAGLAVAAGALLVGLVAIGVIAGVQRRRAPTGSPAS